MSYEDYWHMSKRQQADIIWNTLFVEHSPISEAASGVLTIFQRLGIDTSSRDLDYYRAAWTPTLAEHMDQVMQAAGVCDVVMTNNPFNSDERAVWLEHGGNTDARFHAALRVDQLFTQWNEAHAQLLHMGYDVKTEWTDKTIRETRRFLQDWIEMNESALPHGFFAGGF